MVHFVHLYVLNSDILKRNRTQLAFLAVGTTDTKVRCSTGVTTANPTNGYPNANQLSWAIN